MKVKEAISWKTKLYYIVIIIGLVIIVVGLSCGYYRKNLLDNNFKITKGVVIERQHRRKSSIYVMCKYSVGLHSYTKSSKVNYIESNKKDCFFDVGDSVIIRYYPPSPDNSDVDLDSSYNKWKMPVWNQIKNYGITLGVVTELDRSKSIVCKVMISGEDRLIKYKTNGLDVKVGDCVQIKYNKANPNINEIVYERGVIMSSE